MEKVSQAYKRFVKRKRGNKKDIVDIIEETTVRSILKVVRNSFTKESIPEQLELVLRE